MCKPLYKIFSEVTNIFPHILLQINNTYYNIYLIIMYNVYFYIKYKLKIDYLRKK